MLDTYTTYKVAQEIMKERHKEAENARLLRAMHQDRSRFEDHLILRLSDTLISLGRWIKERYELKHAPQFTHNPCTVGAQCDD
jgi:hypothetical protein